MSETKTLVEPGPASGFDLALRSGGGGWPGARAEPLMNEALMVVCAPVIGARLSVPADLATVPLLHDEDPKFSWLRWTEAAGLQQPAWAKKGTRLASSALVLQAASTGEGAALVPERLAAGYLRQGALVRPFSVRVPLGSAYWPVKPPRGSPTAATRAFSTWLHGQARTRSTAAPAP